MVPFSFSPLAIFYENNTKSGKNWIYNREKKCGEAGLFVKRSSVKKKRYKSKLICFIFFCVEYQEIALYFLLLLFLFIQFFYNLFYYYYYQKK